MSKTNRRRSLKDLFNIVCSNHRRFWTYRNSYFVSQLVFIVIIVIAAVRVTQFLVPVPLGSRMLSNKTKKKVRMPIRELSIIGERNSGTKWVFNHLYDCFNHTLIVRDQLVRFKHWFQHDVPNGRERVGTAVIAVFRDPYYWIEAMRLIPHHSPLHYQMRWEEFVKTPWTMPRLPSDFEERAKAEDPRNIGCQEYFNYEQVVSCRELPYPEGYFNSTVPANFDRPQYELRDDGSGLPYGSIIDMRRDKIKNYLSVTEWNWVQDFFQVRYEDLLSKGTKYLIKHIEEVTGVQAKCDSFPPQNRSPRDLEGSYVKWMTEFVDWETEALIGYKPWNSMNSPY
jgi:hypothetical protein